MCGTKYGYAATQIAMNEGKYEYCALQVAHDVLHPDAHMLAQEDFYQAEPDVVAMIMTQLSLKARLRHWGDRGYDAAYAEMKQLHMRDTFSPKHWEELSPLQKKTILESHMFVKEKRDKTIKGRTVAEGNKQHDYISKEDVSSPTVSTESVLLSYIVNAEEERDVAVIDIPNLFIETRVEHEEDKVIIKLRGVLVDILLDVAPELYKDYVMTGNKGIKQFIVQCQNAIYGAMIASLLYYRKFTTSIIGYGFKINPHNPCVANKIVDGNQMTILYHVDDCKLSHVDPKANDDMITWLRKNYESTFKDGSGEMKVSRGNVHTFLGMMLDFTTPGEVIISMFDYIDELLSAFEKEEPSMKGTKSSAAPSDLFKVDENCEKLRPNKAVVFHNLSAKTLNATKRARPDTSTSVAFLTTRVREPDKDDRCKLCHLMKYIRGTKRLPLRLSANGSGILKWWIDASFAIHPNMHGHSGGGLSLGRGFPIASSMKQKLNTRSLTPETEVVGVDDFMPAICWSRYFMEAQGYVIQDNIVLKDNKSSMLL
jgi:hypothetical protein